MNFGEKLVQLRKGKGMSQEDLAVLLKQRDRLSASGKIIRDIPKQIKFFYSLIFLKCRPMSC